MDYTDWADGVVYAMREYYEANRPLRWWEKRNPPGSWGCIEDILMIGLLSVALRAERIRQLNDEYDNQERLLSEKQPKSVAEFANYAAAFDELYTAAANLRQAQRDYMEVRKGPRDEREEFGRTVAEAASALDDALAAIADRNPSGGDVQQAPSRSDESGGAGTAIAQHNQ